jgi:intracellular septation protein A
MNRCIGGVMVSVFGSNAVNFGFDTQSGQKVKPKIIKLVFTASLLSTQQ